MTELRLLQLGIEHPHAGMYRTTIDHHPGITLVGGYDPDPLHAAALLREEARELPVFDTIAGALAGAAADAVLITLPNDVTPAAIIAAADAGLAIVAEKPGAMTTAAFLPALAAITARNVPFLAAYLRRVSPAAHFIRDLIAEGLLGDLLTAHVTFATTNARLRNAAYLSGRTIESVAAAPPAALATSATAERYWLFDRARAGGGIMHWLGVHWLDLLRLVSGDEFTHVTATLSNSGLAPIDVEDRATVTLAAAGGMMATIACAYVLQRGPDEVAIALHGSAGSVSWPGGGAEVMVRSSHPAWRAASTRHFRFEPDPVPGYSGALGWELFERFRATVQDGAPAPTTATDARRVLELLDAIQQSSAEHRRVVVARHE